MQREGEQADTPELKVWYWWISESFKPIALANPVAIAVMLLHRREGGWSKHNGGHRFIQVRLHRPPRKSVQIYDIIVRAGFYLVVAYHAHCSRHTHMHTHPQASRGLQRRLPAEWIKTACTLWQASLGPSVCLQRWLWTLLLLVVKGESHQNITVKIS